MVEHKIGDYIYSKFLGEGSFGKVYKGKNMKSGEDVAVKTMEMKLFKDPFLIESLKNEIKVMR
jgi:5'-AMP-activated protein kinase, catalytic alpha subunit